MHGTGVVLAKGGKVHIGVKAPFHYVRKVFPVFSLKGTFKHILNNNAFFFNLQVYCFLTKATENESFIKLNYRY